MLYYIMMDYGMEEFQKSIKKLTRFYKSDLIVIYVEVKLCSLKCVFV